MSNSTAGGLVCVNQQCDVSGLPTTRPQCVRCGNPTHAFNEPGLVVPAPRPAAAAAAGPSKLDTGMEVGSRLVYGGFWAIVAVLAGVGGLALLSQGEPSGLLGLIVAALAGIYATYIFRGGRWRILFW